MSLPTDEPLTQLNSEGVVGSSVPSDAMQVGFKDATGNLAPPKLSAAGNVQTTISEALPAGSNLIGHVQVDDGAGHVQPAGDASARKIFTQPTDGTNSQSYTAASEAKVAVTQPLPAGANIIGQVEQTDGTNILGTAAHPTRVDPTGTTTQPVSGTVTANVGTTNGLALDATLTGGTQKAIARGGAKGATVAADVTSNPVDANTQALHVDGSKVTQPVSAASLPLPSGAATAANQTNGSQETRITDGTNVAAVKAASTAAAAADTALVVCVSPNSSSGAIYPGVATYASCVPVAIGTGSTSGVTTSLAYIWHPATNTKRIEIYRITSSIASGNTGDLAFRGGFITAEAATPGGAVQTVNPLDRADAASSLNGTTGVFRTGATGAPTRLAGDLISEQTVSSQNGQFFLFDIRNSGKPIVLRAGIAEGFEIRTVIGNGNITQGFAGVTMYWTEA